MSVSDQTDPPLVGLDDPRLAFFEIAIDVRHTHPDEIVREAADGEYVFERELHGL